MSDSPQFELVQAEDRVSAPRALTITLLSVLVICLVLVISAWLIWIATGSISTTVEISVPPGTVAPWEIGGVKQTNIRMDHFGERLFASERRQLDSYTWVDRSRGIITIPISEAMKLRARGELPK